ncbi:MAG: Transposase IS200 like protein [bacterium ADurb.Bin478]|nr:MAG: Transposase IS200 like protein [bacterium ADurb.Bin478]
MPFIRIWIHLIWSTKNREKSINQTLRPKLLAHLLENAAKKQIYIDQINCTEDHCHALISLGASQSVKDVAFLLKGESSHWINKNKMTSGHFDWQDEYIALSVSESQSKIVRAYIYNQQEHHRKKSFLEEYNQFIKKYGFKLDRTA